MEALKGMPDIAAASTATVYAWKRLQISTASQLSKLHAAAGRQEEARNMDVDVQVGVSASVWVWCSGIRVQLRTGLTPLPGCPEDPPTTPLPCLLLLLLSRRRRRRTCERRRRWS